MDKPFKISDTTKISELIKADKASIEAIAGVAKPFHRLRNPVLRKIMASRVTIAEAAKMGGCSVGDIVAALTPLGFEYEQVMPPKETAQQPKPGWLLNARRADITWLDVRPVIESGTDPLKEILGKFKNVPEGKILCVINSFVPTPLIHLLQQGKAESSYVDKISENEILTYFLKRKNAGEEEQHSRNDNVIFDDGDSFEAVRQRFSGEKIRETDVRRLEMPQPMHTILNELKTLPRDHVLYVHHKRVPVYLLEELADKHYEIHIHTIGEGDVKMILFEKPYTTSEPR
jgi:uncharacterized protein (DUF2249 family)